MNTQINRNRTGGTQAATPASALQAIALVMPHAADLEHALALVSGVDRASLVHIWNEQWSDDRRKPDAPLGAPR
jgi:hypothetical protein